MSPQAALAIQLARTLIVAGQLDEARELLLNAGYIGENDSDVQRVYLELIPETATLSAMRSDVYTQLAAPEPKVRLRAAIRLGRECAKVYPKDGVRWMRDPRATGPLIDMLYQERDAKVAKRALAALACILCAYFAHTSTSQASAQARYFSVCYAQATKS